jgi:hypothetical protein
MAKLWRKKREYGICSCRHRKCSECERHSLPERSSPWFVCCRCRELNRRKAPEERQVSEVEEYGLDEGGGL